MGISFKNPNISVSEVFCDWLSFTVPVTDAGAQCALRHRLMNVKGMGYKVHQKGRWPYKIGYRICLDEQTGEALNLHCDPWSANTAFFRVELNPRKVHLDFAKAFVAHIAGIPWSEMMESGRVTRFDATVDVTGAHVDDLLVYYPKFQISKCYKKGGTTTGYVLGGYDGNTTVTVYDKAAQIKKLNQKKPQYQHEPVPENLTTRIELSLSPDIDFAQLLQHENVFAKLSVQDYAMLPKVDDELFRVFKQLAHATGAHDALLALNPATRPKFKAKMEGAACPWWNPKAIWEGWSACVYDIAIAQQELYAIGYGP